VAQVLHWFEHNQPVSDASGLLARDYAAEAKALSCSLLQEQCGTVALFMADMAQVQGGAGGGNRCRFGWRRRQGGQGHLLFLQAACSRCSAAAAALQDMRTQP
jgi:hypothetical protein